MSSCPSLDLNFPINPVPWPKPLFVALIGPNERGRRTVASALKNSPDADVFEFDSYPPERGYLRKVLENPFNVLILELDSNAELALELIQEASECPGAAVLAYSIRPESKLTLKALQAGALAYSISKDASELRRQVDKLAAAYSPAEEEATAKRQFSGSDLANTHSHQHQPILQLPSILPGDFDGWDDHTASDASRANETEVLSPKLVEPAESSITLISSPVQPKRHEEEELTPMKAVSANNDLPFGPQTLDDADETILHENSGAATETLLKISTSKLWSGILFSGDEQRTPKFDSARVLDADLEIEKMFRPRAAKTCKGNTLQRKGKIALAISIATVVLLVLGLLFWSHPQPLITMGQTVLHALATSVMQARASTNALHP